MSRTTSAAAVLLLLAAGTGAAVTLAADPAGQDAVRQAAARSDPRIAVGRPVAARPVGVPPRATEVLRLRDPVTRAVRVVTLKRVRRQRGPAADREQWCLDTVELQRSAERRFRASAGCRPVRAAPPMPLPTLLATSSTRGGPTLLSGFVPPEARRLTIAGVGPATSVPLGARGAWLVAVADDVRASLTLTTELRDGTTRFERVRLPAGTVPAAAQEAADPVDDSTWALTTGYRNGGDRRGQTCVQPFNLDAAGREAGFGPPMCGDLRREPFFLDVLRRGPGPRTKFGGGPETKPRLLVWGAASPRIRSLTLVAPGPERDIPIDAEGRGFISVLPAGVAPADVTVRVTGDDGRSRTFAAPRRIGVAPLTRVPLRRTRPLRAELDRERRRILLTLGVRGRPDKVKAVFEHHAVRLGAVPGRPGLYAGALRFRGPVPRRYEVGARFDAYTVICAPGCKDTEEDTTLE